MHLRPYPGTDGALALGMARVIITEGLQNQEYIEKYTLNLKESNSTARQKNNGVILTTMHGSKGLEYNTVFIIDANEGITPHKKSVSEIEISEERRMFYVAMTRAIKNLHIYYSKTRYNKEMEVSRFVAEIMEE